MPGALEGVKILDLSNWIAGPFGTMLLGDLGADVIKVESPHGDGCRPLGPPFQQGESHFFMGINRNKRDIIIDLKTAGGPSSTTSSSGAMSWCRTCAQGLLRPTVLAMKHCVRITPA